MPNVGLKLVLPLVQRKVTRSSCFVGDLRRNWGHLDSFSLEEWHKEFMKVHKVGVAFVNNPLVRALVQAFLAFNSTVSIVMRTDQTLTLKFVLVAFMV